MRYIIVFGALLLSLLGTSQVTISQQDFETVPATPTLNFSNAGAGANTTGNNPAGGSPSNSPLFAGGSRGWGVTPGSNVSTTSTLTFANQSLTGFTNCFATFKLAGMSVNSGNGIDSGDLMTVFMSVDGGTTWSSELTINGATGNSTWAFSATGAANINYDGNNTPTSLSSSSGIAGLSTVSINIPNGSSQIRLRISLNCDNSNERWIIDNVQIRGTASGSSAVISDLSPQTPAQVVFANTTNNVLHQFSVLANANITVSGLTFTTTGTYDASDIVNFKLRYSTDATLDAGDATLSTLSSPGTAGLKTFPSFTNQAIANTATGYFFITMDISANAETGGNTVALVGLTTADLSILSGTKTGSTTASGTQTILPTPVKEIVFTEVDADGDEVEFLTLTKLTLNGWKVTDNGILADGTLQTGENMYTFPASGFTDVPAGTSIRLLSITGTNDLDFSDGVISIFSSGLGGLNASGEQVIVFTGTNTYRSGINWGNSGWNSGAIDNSTSRAPFSATDFAPNTTLDEIYFDPSSTLTGDVDAIISSTGPGIRNFSNWAGTNTGNSNDCTLKDILFTQSDYVSGTISASGISGSNATLNLSALVFSGTNADTRYAVVINPSAAPGSPVDRYTCYSGISSNVATAPLVVSSVTGQPVGSIGNSSCGTPSVGAGRMVYFDYALPSSLILSGLLSGTNYEVRVYAVNGNGITANVGVPNSAGSFSTTGCVAPSVATSNITFSSPGTTSLQLNWTSGNGSARLILARESASPSATPTNGVTYTSNTDFSLAPTLGDSKVVYNGNAASAVITGLTPGTNYFFTIIEYNCSSGQELYFGNSSNSRFTTPSNVILSKGCTDNSTQELAWTFGSGAYDEVVIFARAVGVPVGPGSNNASSYTANSNFSLATDLGTQGRCVYKGTGTTATVTGLTTGVNYTFAAFTYRNATGTVWSSGTTTSQVIALPNVQSVAAIPDNNQINVSWQNPSLLCFDEIMVVANQGAVVFNPSGDGTAYTANSVYSSANQVMYKGTSVGCSVSGLTNGTNYCFRIFVRRGTQWSSGIEVCAIPAIVTNFEPGDLAIVAINTQVLGSGSTDEVCFVAFKDITPGTTFFMTDNGYERANANQWGDTEGLVRLTRSTSASTIPAGTVICINGPYTTDPRYDVVVCGVIDNSNWIVDPNVIGAGVSTFDLNSTDQVWITQGGAWNNPSGAQNATYSGTPLYGWSGIDWKTNIGNTSPTWTTSGSRLIPGTECFTTSLNAVVNNDKSKYTGPITTTTRLGWIARINNPGNWSGYASNSGYDGAPAAYDYVNQCIVFNISTATEVAGRWTGEKNDDWFDCANWETRVVPDQTTSVIIQNVAGPNNNANIDYNATNAYLYGGVASCNDLTISQKELRLTGSALDVLEVFGNINIGLAGTLDMSDGSAALDGEVRLRGNWTNALEANFKQGDGTVRCIGSQLQIINTADANEVFNVLSIENVNHVALSKPVQVLSELRMVAGNIQNGANTLTLGSGTSTPGVLSHTLGRIIGSFNRRLNANGVNYLFPIGTNTQSRFTTYNFSNVTPGSLTVSFNGIDPGSLGLPLLENNVSIDANFTEGYWNAIPANGLASTNYALTIDAVGFTSQSLTNATRLVRRNSTGSWVLDGLHQNLSGTLIRRQGMTSFGEYGAASGRECITSLNGPSIPSQIVCTSQELSPVTVTPANGTGPFTYQWYNNPINSNTGGYSQGSLLGGQTNTLAPPVDAESSIYYYLEITQPGSLCPMIASTPALVSVIEVIASTVTITASVPNVCSGGSVTFSSFVSNAGANPLYQWFRNDSPIPSETGAAYNTSGLMNGDEIQLRVTSVSFCTNGTQVFSNSIISSVTTPQMYYVDIDGDGYPANTGGVLTCVAPSGYVALPPGDINNDGQPDFDCADNNDDINPVVEEYCNGLDDDCDGSIDEGLGAVIYYADADGDGFGNSMSSLSSCDIPVGYVINALDCDDNNPLNNPLGLEVCDGFDNDCDGTIDEGCGPINDQRANALLLPMQNYGVCSTINGTLLGATVSPQALSTVITGQDVWYYFTATSPGVSITCSTALNNILLEFQSSSGTLINVENVNSAIGEERLNIQGLLLGETYYLCVRNFNSAQGVGGPFSLCGQRLMASELTNETAPINPCATIKASFTNANQYIFNVNGNALNGLFASTVGGSVNTLLSLNGVPGITYGTTYTNVTVDAMYALTDGLGNAESITITGVVAKSFSTSVQPSLQLRVQDSCPNQVTASTWVRADPQLCGGVINYEWEFTQVLPTLASAVTALRNANDRLWRVSWIPGGAQAGATYNVRVRPIFTGNIPGSWSTAASCLKIAGGSGMVVQEGNEDFLHSADITIESSTLKIYPNPITNGILNYYIEGAGDGLKEVKLYDGMGKLVWVDKAIAEEGQMIGTLILPSGLAPGLYTLSIGQVEHGVVSSSLLLLKQ